MNTVIVTIANLGNRGKSPGKYSAGFRAIVVNRYIGLESCFYIKTLALTFDFALLLEPVNNIPYFPAFKACLVY